MTIRVSVIEAPWMIHPSKPALRLFCEEGEPSLDAVVGFLGFFGRSPELVSRWGQFRRIEVAMKGVLLTRVYPGHLGAEATRLQSFDWGSIPGCRIENASQVGVESWSDQQWIATGLCPDPRAYELSNSDEMDSVGADPVTSRHYLFRGRRFNIEVVGDPLTWRTVGDPLAEPTDEPMRPPVVDGST